MAKDIGHLRIQRTRLSGALRLKEIGLPTNRTLKAANCCPSRQAQYSCRRVAFAIPKYVEGYHSQLFVLNPKLVAFSETARLIWSDAPSGNSALISTVTFREALGSEESRLVVFMLVRQSHRKSLFQCHVVFSNSMSRVPTGRSLADHEPIATSACSGP